MPSAMATAIAHIVEVSRTKPQPLWTIIFDETFRTLIYVKG
jgi:hypothetical protein